MTDSKKMPYEVTGITHGTSFKDGKTQGEYTVQIQHASGVKSSFTVPEGPDSAAQAHAKAMEQVDQAQQIAHLPAGAA